MVLGDLAVKRPELVDFFPPPLAEDVERFESDFGFKLPQILKDHWLQWGTGVVFETEEIFSPAENRDTGESAFTVNREGRKRGLPNELVIFHRGLGGVTCVNAEGQVFQVDENEFTIVHRFATIDDWFKNVLVQEYGNRYGLH